MNMFCSPKPPCYSSNFEVLKTIYVICIKVASKFSYEMCFLVNCEWSAWDAWSRCSNACGIGSKHRERRISVPESHGGLPCDGPAEESSQCLDKLCGQFRKQPFPTF